MFEEDDGGEGGVGTSAGSLAARSTGGSQSAPRDPADRPSRKSAKNAAGKRPRVRFTPDQLSVLHKTLAKTNYPSTEERQAIATSLNIPVRRVQVWFQNQRQNRKRHQDSPEISQEFGSSAEASPVVYTRHLFGDPATSAQHDLAPAPPPPPQDAAVVPTDPYQRALPTYEQRVAMPQPTHAAHYDWTHWTDRNPVPEAPPEFVGQVVAPNAHVFPLVRSSTRSEYDSRSTLTEETATQSFQPADGPHAPDDAYLSYQSDTSSVPALDSHGMQSFSSGTTFSPTQSFDSDMLFSPANVFPLTEAFNDTIAARGHGPKPDFSPSEIPPPEIPHPVDVDAQPLWTSYTNEPPPEILSALAYRPEISVPPALQPASRTHSDSSDFSSGRSAGRNSTSSYRAAGLAQPQSIFSQERQGRPLSGLFGKFRRRSSRSSSASKTDASQSTLDRRGGSIGLLDAALATTQSYPRYSNGNSSTLRRGEDPRSGSSSQHASRQSSHQGQPFALNQHQQIRHHQQQQQQQPHYRMPLDQRLMTHYHYIDQHQQQPQQDLYQQFSNDNSNVHHDQQQQINYIDLQRQQFPHS